MVEFHRTVNLRENPPCTFFCLMDHRTDKSYFDLFISVIEPHFVHWGIQCPHLAKYGSDFDQNQENLPRRLWLSHGHHVDTRTFGGEYLNILIALRFFLFVCACCNYFILFIAGTNIVYASYMRVINPRPLNMAPTRYIACSASSSFGQQRQARPVVQPNPRAGGCTYTAGSAK